MKFNKKNLLIWAGVAILLVVGLFLVVPEVMAQDNSAGGDAVADTSASTSGDAAKKAATDKDGKASTEDGTEAATADGSSDGTGSSDGSGDGTGDNSASGGSSGGTAAPGGSGNSGGNSGNGSTGNTGNGNTGNTGNTGNGGGNGGGGGNTVNNQKTCTLAIDCATILNNKGQLNPAKAGYVPSDGWIMGRRTVTFTEGESVFDILKRECQTSGIHMEFVFTPMYNSVYVEGINNLYEFDCGELSGWMYKVNGWYPNYGCSLYYPQNGDVIEWRYTCDLGEDVGGGWAVTG